jgi:hypothetical protein
VRSKILAGTASLSAPIFVTNSSAGGGLGSLVFNSSGLVGEYRRAGSSTWTAISLVSATAGTYTSGGWIADGGLTGAYEVGIPNAALASGEPWVAVRFYGATNMTPVLLYFELDAVNYQSSTAFVTSVPAVTGAVGSVTGAVGSVTGLTTAAIATAVLTDAGDNTTTGTPGKILAQLLAAFTTTTSSVFSTASLVNAPTGGSAPSVAAIVAGMATAPVGSVSSAVTVSLTQPLAAARALDAIADTSLTVNDALHCAIAAATGQQTLNGTAYTIETPHTATVLRTFTLNSATAPTSRS